MEQIPWIEKYRPHEFESIILEKNNKLILKAMIKEDTIPHLLFYGPPGTGKTTTIINLIHEYQKYHKQEHGELIVHLNASDDRGIEAIRNEIQMFTNASHLFNKGTKFIILDEIDYMTKTAQYALYNLIKDSNTNVTFCLICNYVSKLHKSLQNIAMAFKFNTLPRQDIFSFLKNIIKSESIINLKQTDINDIIELFKSDIRSMINYIQGLSQNKTKHNILSETKINDLIHTFLNKPIDASERKIIHYMYKYNIEKQELVIRIINNVVCNYKITQKMLFFIKSILHNNNYYLDEFNNFFISNLVSLLSK
jgi:replication factor C subunit 3/5